MRNMKLFAAAAVVLCAAMAFAASPQPTVTTENGPVTGLYNQAAGVYSFKGLPYAEPPVSDLRLRGPKRLNRTWTTPLNATAFSPGCLSRICEHISFEIPYICPAKTSEDCLYANVWTPVNASMSSSPLPVLVFIHGGGYIMGSASATVFDGSVLSGRNNVVVVTFNYRLGALGGLYLGGNSSVTGNYQLQDQIAALRWIQRNIAAFGGDPSRVTISGESAGATSVMLLLLCPETAGLFHAAIVDSHAFASKLLLPSEAIGVGEQVVAAVGCAGAEDAGACLRSSNVSGQDIMAPVVMSPNALFWTDDLFELLPPPFVAPFDLVWAPTSNTPLTPGDYFTQIEKGAFHQVPVMLGTNANETGLFMVTTPINGSLALDSIKKKFGGHDAIVNGVVQLFGEPPATDAALYVSKVATEYLFSCPMRRAAQLLSAWVPTYLYVFDYFVSMPSKYCHNGTVCHGSDLAPLFDPPSYDPTTKNDFEASVNLQMTWATFATNRTPATTSSETGASTEWAPFSLVTGSWMNISVPVGSAGAYRKTTCDFFDAVGYFY